MGASHTHIHLSLSLSLPRFFSVGLSVCLCLRTFHSLTICLFEKLSKQFGFSSIHIFYFILFLFLAVDSFQLAHSQLPFSLCNYLSFWNFRGSGSSIYVFRQHFRANEPVCLCIQMCDIKKERMLFFFSRNESRYFIFYLQSRKNECSRNMIGHFEKKQQQQHQQHRKCQ